MTLTPSLGAPAMRSRWRSLAFLLPLGAALLAAGCSPALAFSPAHPAGTIVAVGAENEYADVISQVGGQYVQVNAIMNNPNTDPHTFEASASVARQVSSAQLVVQNGVGYDAFMNTIEDAVPVSGRKVLVVQRAARPAGQHAEPAPVVPAGHDAGRGERGRGRPGCAAARPRRVFPGPRGRLHRLTARLDGRDRGLQGRLPPTRRSRPRSRWRITCCRRSAPTT